MRNQRGMSLSPFVALLVPVLMVVIGLVVDGGAQATASRRAERVAAAAARAACDDTARARLAGATMNVDQAIAVAQRTISEAGDVTGDVQVSSGRVVVHTKVVTKTILLSLVGIGELKSTGSAEAALVADR